MVNSGLDLSCDVLSVAIMDLLHPQAGIFFRLQFRNLQ